jgi:hypothetical protein
MGGNNEYGFVNPLGIGIAHAPATQPESGFPEPSHAAIVFSDKQVKANNLKIG